MRFSKNAAVSLEGDRIYFYLLNRCLRVAQAKTEYTRRPLGCHAFRPSILARASLCLRLGSDLWSVDDQRIDAPRSELERVRAGRDRLLDRCGPHAVDLHAAALNETARLGRRRDPSRLLDHFPERPPRGFGRQPTTSASGVFSQNWYISYADVFAGSSHTVPASVLPNFEPSLLVTSGSVRPYAGRPWTRRISSTPAVMLPH